MSVITQCPNCDAGPEYLTYDEEGDVFCSSCGEESGVSRGELEGARMLDVSHVFHRPGELFWLENDPFQTATPCWHPDSFIHVTISCYNLD